MSKRKVNSLNELVATSIYLSRVGAVPRSFGHAAITYIDEYGYEKTRADIFFRGDGSISVSNDHFVPTQEEAEAIFAELMETEFPVPIKLTALHDLPDGFDINDPNSFIYEDGDGRIIMLEKKIPNAHDPAKKTVLKFTKFSDGIWRMMEPDRLPIWNVAAAKLNGMIFLHEGVSGAKHILRMLKDRRYAKEHAEWTPWLEELALGAHLAWTGGADNPGRTDWEALRQLNPQRLIIVCDNDMPGREVVPHIARQFDCHTLYIQFDQRWKKFFDLADHFPETLYKSTGAERHYVGPGMIDCMNPGTWATTEREGEGDRPTYEIRRSFSEQWAWIESADIFTCIDFPTKMLRRDQFNSTVRAFSHVRDTADLLLKTFTGRQTSITYRPDQVEKIVIEVGESSVNLFRPTLIKPMKGGVEPFMKFLSYLFPNEDECYQIKRWIATLVAHAETRMAYGILAISETQGVGKTTLGMILADLVGRHNCSFPGEAMIVQQNFNGWIANKRLIVVNEIYSGHSWQAYHRLKSYLTDELIEVNIKHLKTYTTPNWTHFYVCSNSLSALKVEDHDRRWFMPRVTEVAWREKQFEEFRQWLAAGGLRKIFQWCKDWNDVVRPGEIAPMTESKLTLIDESRSDAQTLAKTIGEVMMMSKAPVVTMVAWVKDFCGEELNEKVYDTERKIGQAMKISGVAVTDKEVIYRGRKMRLASNAPHLLNGKFDEDEIKKALKHPRELMAKEL